MILPPSLQILLHTSVLVWTAYYLIVKPSAILESKIVVIFGQALQLVDIQEFHANFQPHFSVTRFGNDGLAFGGLTLLYVALSDTIPLFRNDWTYYRATGTFRIECKC